MSKYKFFALGGLGENGKNMYCIETENDILVLDAGLKYPPSSRYGINTIVADYKYLIDNQKKVKGIVISHGHDDQIGALKFIVKQLPHIKIYVTGLAALFVKKTLKDVKHNPSNIISYDPDKELKIGSLKLDFAYVCHNTIDNHIMFIDIGGKSVVYATDFIMARDVNPHFSTDRNKLFELSKKHNVDLLAIQCLGATNYELISPKHKITKYIEDDIELSKGRVFYSIYEQNILFADEIIRAAKSKGKKIIIYGKTCNDALTEVFKRKIINTDGLIIGDYKNINNETNAVILICGNSETLYGKVNSICEGLVPEITFKEGDLFVNAAAAFDGGEVRLANMMDALTKSPVKVKALPFKQILPTHAGIEDIKQLIDIVSPSHIVTIKGDWKSMTHFKEQISPFHDAKKIFTINNGDVLLFDEGRAGRGKKPVYTCEMLSQTTGNDEIVTAVLEDRERLAKSGIVLVSVAVSQKGEVLGNVDVKTVGITLNDEEKIIASITKVVLKEIGNKFEEGLQKIRISIRNKAQRIIMKQANKQPQVLTVVSIINGKPSNGPSKRPQSK